jgi:para-aminobenzoate synthetase/4-amino-4-deoxychorismate lyase
VRLLLHRNGEVTLSHEPVMVPDTEMRYVRAGTPVDSGDTFLYHKTTRRVLYDLELGRQRERCGCDEVLFVNERGEVTEGAWNNVFVAGGDRLFTPPLHCGVLAGTLRRHLLAGHVGSLPYRSVREKVLTWQDVVRADAVYFGNSVRGLRRARLLEPTLSS